MWKEDSIWMNRKICYHTHPQLHTSMAGEYLSSPSRSSGGRYHSVITLLVYGRLGARQERERWDSESIHWASMPTNAQT